MEAYQLEQEALSAPPMTPSDAVPQTPLPSTVAPLTPLPHGLRHETVSADPLSHAAPSAREVLKGPSYEWTGKDHLSDLVGPNGSVDGVHMPEPTQGGVMGLFDRARSLLALDAPGMNIRELGKALSETNSEIRALDQEAQGAIRTSPEGWRFGHPEMQARWQAMERGYADGSLRDMRIEVETERPDGTPMGARERAEALLDAVDRGAAAMGEADLHVPRALSGPLSDYARDHPAPGSEEALPSKGDVDAVERESARVAQAEASRETAQEQFWSRQAQVEQAQACDVSAGC